VIEKQTVINYGENEIKCYIKDKLLTDEVMCISKLKFNQDMFYNIQNVINVMHSKYACIQVVQVQSTIQVKH